MKEKIKTFKSVGIVTSFTILSVIFSVLLQIILAYLYGTKREMDVYFLTLSVPLFVSGIILSTMAVVFIPLFKEFLVKNKTDELWGEINVLMNYLLLIMLVITAVIFFFSPLIISRMAPGFSQDSIALAISLLRILSFSIIPLGIYSLCVIIYYSEESFLKPVFIRSLGPLCIILFVVFFNRFFGIKSIAWGFVFGSTVQTFLSLYYLNKDKRKFKFSLSLAKPKIAGIWYSGIIVMAGIFSFGLIDPTEKFLATGLGGGSVSYLGYIERLFSILILLPSMAVPTVILPQLAGYFVADDIPELRSTFSAGFRSTLFITLPLLVVLFIFREELIRLFLQRGAFDHRATIYTAMGLAFYLGVFFESERMVILNTLYAMKDIITPLVTSVLTFILYIMIAIPLSQRMSFLGLALAHSIACLVFNIINLAVLRLKLKGIDALKIAFSSIRMALSALLAGIIMWLLFKTLNGGVYSESFFFESLKLGISFLVGACLYIGLCFLLRLEELKHFFDIIVSYKQHLFIKREQGYSEQ